MTDHRIDEGPSDDESSDDRRNTWAARHHRFGWWSLVVFVGVGLVLESLLGFRTPLLVDADVETRRTMFRLAHAHGALLALVNLALAASLRSGALAAEHSRRTSMLVLVGSVALPAGFFLGGVWFHQADPGLGIVLVPIGALTLVAGLVAIARRSGAARREGDEPLPDVRRVPRRQRGTDTPSRAIRGDYGASRPSSRAPACAA